MTFRGISLLLLLCLTLPPAVQAEEGAASGGVAVKSGGAPGMSAADLSEGAAARIAVLRRTAAALERAARLRAANTLDAEQAAQVAGYERWLRMQSARLRDLAMGWEGRLARGASAGEMQEICRYYQQEGAQLQERLSRENRQFPVSSPTLKQKHALAQQAIEALH